MHSELVMIMSNMYIFKNYIDKNLSENDQGIKKKRAATCDFQQCGILTSIDSDQPMQAPFKLRNSK